MFRLRPLLKVAYAQRVAASLKPTAKLAAVGARSYSRANEPWNDSRNVNQAFAREIEAITSLSTLFNQTTSHGLQELRDITPMMEIYSQLKGKHALTSSVTQSVASALSRSAKDTTILLRNLPTREKKRAMENIFTNLKNHCDVLVNDIIEGNAPNDLRTVGTLLSVYEVIDPIKGVDAFTKLDMPEVTGSAIPCMVKANSPLELIEAAFNQAPRKHARLVANMVWAYLVHNQADKAISLSKRIHDAPGSVEEFVLSAFVGDAPADVALKYFNEAFTAPNPSSMVRFLIKMWQQAPDVDQQLAIFERYLKLSRGLKESHFKTVTYQLVENVLSVHMKPETASADIENLGAVYSNFSEHKVFLNVLLSQVSKRWPTAENLILQIFKEYGVESSPVSFRVRLNALEQLEFEERDRLIAGLWNARVSLPEPLNSYDWLALAKAGGPVFEEAWQVDRPFERSIGRFVERKNRK